VIDSAADVVVIALATFLWAIVGWFVCGEPVVRFVRGRLQERRGQAPAR
jgi:hypothetical protein